MCSDKLIDKRNKVISRQELCEIMFSMWLSGWSTPRHPRHQWLLDITQFISCLVNTTLCLCQLPLCLYSNMLTKRSFANFLWTVPAKSWHFGKIKYQSCLPSSKTFLCSNDRRLADWLDHERILCQGYLNFGDPQAIHNSVHFFGLSWSFQIVPRLKYFYTEEYMSNRGYFLALWDLALKHCDRTF